MTRIFAVLSLFAILFNPVYSYENDNFFKAAKRGDVMRLRFYITLKDVDVNSRSEHPTIKGWTALHVAVRSRQSDAVEYLLDKGADPNIKDKNGNSPLKYAVHDTKLIQLLLDNGAAINDWGERGSGALVYAKATNMLEGLEYLIDKGANVNTDSILCFSGYKKKLIKTAQLLIQNGAHINTVYENGWSPLHCSASNNQHLTNYFITTGADTNIRGKNGDTPLFAAASNTIPILVKHGAELEAVNNNGDTPIFSRIFKRKRVAALIEAGANVNHINKYGISPLIAQALRESDPYDMKLLLDAGADTAYRVSTEQINNYLKAKNSNRKFVSMRETHSALDIYKDVYEKKYTREKASIYKDMLEMLAAK